MTPKSHHNIILFGYPRSGTTWISEVLTCTGELKYLHEPDNERTNISGLLAKKGGPRFPILDPENKLQNLFKQTLNGNFIDGTSWKTTYPIKALGYTVENLEQFIDSSTWKKSISNKGKLLILDRWNCANLKFNAKIKQQKLIKTVHAGLLLEPLSRKLDFTPIISLRHPAAIIKSMQQLNNKDIYRGIEKDPNLKSIVPQKGITKISSLKTNLEKQALQISIHHYYWAELLKTQNILTIKHEGLLLDSKAAFKNIYTTLGLNYNTFVDDFIDSKNKSGSGYGTSRNTTELLDTWKKGFTQDELNQIERGYKTLPSPWYKDFSL